MSNGTQFIEDWTGDQIGQPPSNWTNLYGGSGITAEVVVMHYYRVRAIVDEGIVRPDIPDDAPFVGNTDGQWYLIATPAELPTHKNCQQCQPSELGSVCQEIGLSLNDVLRWRVRKEAERRGPVHRKVGRRQRRRPAS